jgi:putative oxidoreductase
VLDLLTEPFGTSTVEWVALPLRLALGVIFIDGGFGKYHRGLSGTGRWMEGLGIPFPQLSARLVATTELVGGVLLLLGLLTHWVAIPLAFDMGVAILVAKFRMGAPFQGGEVQGYDLNVILAAACVALVLSGAGELSLDRLIN